MTIANKELPKISVIIPTFNRARLIGATIDSALNQSYPNIEIIVVDDGSLDDTAQVIQNYGNKVQYIRQENKGNSAARNNGLRQATGEYIGFLDDDDMWLKSKIEKEVAFLQKHPDFGFVYCDTYFVDQNDQIIAERTRHNDEDLTFERIYSGNIIVSPSVTLVRRKCVEDVGGFDEKLIQSSDYDLWLRLAKKYPFGHINEILAKYRVHDHTLSKNLDRRLTLHEKILLKPEISGARSWLQKRIRLADDYYAIAGLYMKDKRYRKAAIKYLGALCVFPFIGFYHWPTEIKNARFSFVYRICKVYFLVIYCLVKSFVPDQRGKVK